MLSRSSRVLGSRLLSRFPGVSASSASSASSFSAPSRFLTSSRSLRLDSRPLLLSAPSSSRPLSSKASPEGEPKQDGGEDPDAPKDQYGESGSVSTEVLTPGQKVVETYYKLLWGGAAVLAAACAYYIIRELLPTKMSPNSVFDSAFDRIKKDASVKRRFGEDLKAFGRDSGARREGRRNFIENTQYVAKEEDGSNRTRIRFNLEGEFGDAFVFAEVSDRMPSGEFVYILVQDKRGGEVLTIIDNRSAIRAQAMMGGGEASGGLAGLLGTQK